MTSYDTNTENTPSTRVRVEGGYPTLSYMSSGQLGQCGYGGRLPESESEQGGAFAGRDQAVQALRKESTESGRPV